MSNSKYVQYTKISPYKTSPRNRPIDTITIHCVAGNCSIETIGGIFANPSSQASSNYGIGSDGRVGLYCDERDRSWATSSASNDNRAVTIEVANDSGGPEWHVTDAAMESLIKLIADICERNGIKKLLWRNDKTLIGKIDQQNMTVHRWFANKACPGEYLYNRHGYIADAVNGLLNPVTPIEIKGFACEVEEPQAAQAPIRQPKEVKPVAPQPVFIPYLITPNTSALNIRKNPSIDSTIMKVLINDKSVYTVCEEADGPGATKWCKLKSGIGWISKDFIKKV